jgi:hypothetical protein
VLSTELAWALCGRQLPSAVLSLPLNDTLSCHFIEKYFGVQEIIFASIFSGYELFSICQPPILKYQPEVRLFIPENHHPEVRLFIPEDQTSRRLKA